MAGIEIDETKVAPSPQPSAPSEQLPLFAPEVVAKVRRDHARWRADAAKKAPWKNDFTTVSAMEVNPLAAPDDAMLRAVLVKLFADRQLAVDDGLISFLMVRIERSFAAARSVVAELDREALRRQRPVTRALAGEILGAG